MPYGAVELIMSNLLDLFIVIVLLVGGASIGTMIGDVVKSKTDLFPIVIGKSEEDS